MAIFEKLILFEKNENKSSCIFFIFLFLVCFSDLYAGAVDQDDHHPNIIIILADDMGTGDLGMNGSPIRTPNIDQLAGEGVYLNNFYASANVCTPSRAGLLTGRYAIRMGLAHSVGEIMKTLAKNKLQDNTLVFFTSDNGAWFEGSNTGFRDMKGLSWDGGYRVPLIAWWPGTVPAGTRIFLSFIIQYE